MKSCVPPHKTHVWEVAMFTPSSGSTLVECIREGCGEIGYRIDNKIVAQDLGHENEEGLF